MAGWMVVAKLKTEPHSELTYTYDVNTGKKEHSIYSETDFVDKLKKDVPGVLTVTRELNEKKDPGISSNKGCIPLSGTLLEAVMDLENLVELRIVGIPTNTQVQFGRLENLKKLVLQGIKLSNLHHSIGKLRNLQSLSLQHNNLYDLPFTLEWLEHLEYLDISGNFFTILPRAVYHLRGLKVLKGLNSCPLIVKPEWRRSKYRGWSFHRYNTPAAVTLTQPQTLQDAALRSALGINCWKAGLPTKCCLLLTESEISTRHDMCENCNKPTRRVMPDQEPEGYLATIIIPMFFGFEDVPFRFAACSEDCKNKVDRRFEALQHQSTYGSQAKASHTILEPYHIWALRRLSKLGCYGDNSLRVDPAQLAANPDLDLVDDEAILEKITMAKPM